MKRRRPTERTPWWFAASSIIVLLVALGIVGIFGVYENTRLQDSSELAIRYDVAVAAAADDLLVDITDLRFQHRNIVFSGPTDTLIADYDTTYASLLHHIDKLDAIGISSLNAPQPSQLRDLVTSYHDAFRPTIVLFTSDPVAFNNASTIGLEQIDRLDMMATQIDDAGQMLTEQSLEDVGNAAKRERVILISLLSGVALIGVLLSVLAGRVLQRLHTANASEQESSRQLSTALRLKSDFIADASHELRTPLTLIRGNAEIGLTSPEGGARTQALSEILSESTRMSHLVDDLLFLARSDGGSPFMDREYLPVRLLVSRLIGPAQALSRSHGIALVTDMNGEGHVVADPERISQAVLILIDNATRFTPVGADIQLSSRSDGRSVWIEVQDQGPGIPEADLPLIFERFFQVQETGARKRGGAGLGLSIAKSIVDAHDGQVTVASSPERGTKFSIALPLAQIE